MKNTDYTEFEAKFYPVDKEEYRKKLIRIGARLTIPERKMVRIVADRRINPVLNSGKYIRVRDEGNTVRLSVKFMAEATGIMSDQKEIDVEVSDFEKTKKIIENCGIKFNRKQENSREEWSYKGAQITIDSWPGLDPFSEIEAGSESGVKKIVEELGFDWNKKIIVPAADVYAMVYRMNIEDVLEKISNITFENNPFKDLRKYQI